MLYTAFYNPFLHTVLKMSKHSRMMSSLGIFALTINPMKEPMIELFVLQVAE